MFIEYTLQYQESINSYQFGPEYTHSYTIVELEALKDLSEVCAVWQIYR